MKSTDTLTGNAIFDYCKFILVIMVLAIHTTFLPDLLYPWLRLAVPLFFIMTGYFLFQKMATSSSQEEKNSHMLAFIKRNLKLYIFWFLILLPYTLYIRKWFSDNIILGIVFFLRSLLFSSTFVASWYIMASILAALLVYFLSQKLSNKALFILSGCVFLITCVWSSYSFLLNQNGIVKSIMGTYYTYFGAPCTSSPVALFWIVCGKCFADGDLKNILAAITSHKHKIIAIIVCAALLYAEWYIVRLSSGAIANDCYIMLAPLALVIFSCFINIHIAPSERALFLRKSSTIIYAMHGTVAPILFWIFGKFGYSDNRFVNVVVFISTFLICIASCFVILKLEKVKGFRWLKYSH